LSVKYGSSIGHSERATAVGGDPTEMVANSSGAVLATGMAPILAVGGGTLEGAREGHGTIAKVKKPDRGSVFGAGLPRRRRAAASRGVRAPIWAIGTVASAGPRNANKTRFRSIGPSADRLSATRFGRALRKAGAIAPPESFCATRIRVRNVQYTVGLRQSRNLLPTEARKARSIRSLSSRRRNKKRLQAGFRNRVRRGRLLMQNTQALHGAAGRKLMDAPRRARRRPWAICSAIQSRSRLEKERTAAFRGNWDTPQPFQKIRGGSLEMDRNPARIATAGEAGLGGAACQALLLRQEGTPLPPDSWSALSLSSVQSGPPIPRGNETPEPGPASSFFVKPRMLYRSNPAVIRSACLR